MKCSEIRSPDYEPLVQRVLSGGPGVSRIFGDASTRSYFRVDTTGGSVVVMRLADDPLKSDEWVGDIAPKDIPFLEVATYLRRARIPIPEVLFVDRQRNMIVLEDLGDMTLERALMHGESKEWLYTAAVSLMVELHAYAARNPDPQCIAFRRTFDKGILRWELDHFREWLLEEHAGARLSPADRRLFEAFRDDLADRLSGLPKGFVHRDYQSRNLMLKDGGLFLIDFQDALQGPYIYDIVALLRDSYVKFTGLEVRTYLAKYLDGRREAGLDAPGLDEALTHFHLQALQRKLKDAGRFVYIDRVRKNPKFLPNIPRSLAYAREALEYLDEYSDVARILAKHLGEDWGRDA